LLLGNQEHTTGGSASGKDGWSVLVSQNILHNPESCWDKSQASWTKSVLWMAEKVVSANRLSSYIQHGGATGVVDCFDLGKSLSKAWHPCHWEFWAGAVFSRMQ
jgi:hypothetical protein